MSDTLMPSTGGMVLPPNAATQPRLPDGSINPLYQPVAAGIPMSQPGNTSPFTPFLAPAMPAAPAATYQHSGLGEIAAGFARGVASGVPEALGQSMEYGGRLTGSQGLQNAGQSVAQFGQHMPESLSWLQASAPGTHGAVVNTLANAAEGIGSFAPSIALGMVNPVAGIAAGAAQMAGQSGEQTYEQAQAKGVAQGDAMKASLLNAGIGLATGVAGGAIGGKLMGAVADPIANLVGRSGATLAQDTVQQLAGTGGILAPTLRQLPMAMGEAGAVNAAQAAGTAEVNKQYGIDDTSPLAAAGQGFVQGMALGAMGTPAALAGRALMARTARQQTAVLANPDTGAALRGQLADAYTRQIARADPAAAANFRANAQTAIEHGLPLSVTPDLLAAGNVQPPPMPEFAGPPTMQPNPQQPLAPTLPTAAVPGEQGALFNEAMAPAPQGPQRPAAAAVPEREPETPAGHFGPELFAPENMSATALLNARAAQQSPTADTQGVIDQLTGVDKAPALTRDQFADLPENTDLKGQQLAKAFKAYQAAPVAYERTQRTQALEDYFAQPSGQRVQDGNGVERELSNGELFDMHNQQPAAPELPPLPTPPATADTRAVIDETTGVGRTADAQDSAQRAQALEDHFAQPSGVRVQDDNGLERELTNGELHDLRYPQPETTNQPDSNAPLSRDETLDAARGALKDAGLGGLGQVGKRLADAGVHDARTRVDQIDALRAAVESAREGTKTRDGLQALLDRWAPAQSDAAPAQDDVSAGEATPAPALPDAVPVNDFTQQPEAAAQAQVAMPQNTATDPTQTALDRMNTLKRGLVTMQEDNAGLSPTTQGWLDAADQHVESLYGHLTGETPLDEAALGNTVKQANALYNRAQTMLPDEYLERRGGIEASNPAILDAAAQSGKLSDSLGHIAANGSTDEAKALAKRLQPLTADTTISRTPLDAGAQGRYYSDANHIDIHPGQESEATVLHEAAHAALYNTTERLLNTSRPRNQDEAQQAKALRDMEDVRQRSLAAGGTEYGLSNIHDFQAELFANPKFQDFLREQGTQKSLWQRALDAARRMLGMKVDDRSALEKAMSAGNTLLDAAAREREFNASPQGALRTTDTVLNRMARDVDRIKPDQMRRVGLGMFKSLLGAQTQDFTLHMAQGVPEFRQFGFDKALKANLDARDATDRASRELGEPMGKFADSLRKLLPDTDKGNKLGQDMMRVAGEAAIRGVDFTKNAEDNRKAGNDVPPGMEATVNDIYRQYTQLPKEARDALGEGAKHNLRQFTQTMATVVRARMEALTGQVGRLQAELDRIPPGDATRARAQERLAAATAEADFVAKHIPGLDILAHDVVGAKGSGEGRFDASGKVLDTRLKAVFAGSRETLANGTPLRAALTELDGMYQAQTRNPYYSLGRDGDYFVNVALKGDVKPEAMAKLQQAALLSNKVIGDLKGQTHAFMRVRSLDEAEGLYNRLRQAGGDALDLSNSSHGLLADTAMRSVYGVTGALRQIESDLHDSMEAGGLSSDDAALAKQIVTRSLLNLLPETAARSAKMQRRGVPGYDADYLANFARRAQGGVQDVAQLYAARSRGAALKSMQDTADAMKRTGTTANAAKAQMIVDEMQHRFASSTQRLDNSAVNMINAFGHAFYLAASPAFLIRTMAQPYHRGVPEVGARYGFVNAAREMGRATGTAIKVIQRSMAAASKDAGGGLTGARAAMNTGVRFDDLGLNASDTQFLRDIHSMGVLELGQTQQIQHAAQGLSQGKQDSLRFLSMAAQYAEMTNRMVVGMAAFRLAMRDSRIGDLEARRIAATEYAVKSINNAMDNFKSENTARYIGKNGVLGKVTPLATAFMNYQLQTMQQIIRSVHDGYFGQDKSVQGLQRAKEARRTMYGLLATTSIIAGSMGLPFATAIAGIYNTVHNLMDPDDPRDVRDDFRNYLNTTFGREGGDLIADGPIASALHMDTSTYGLQSIMPGSDFLAARGQLKDRLADQSQALLGPAINAGLDITQGIGKMIDGNYAKGIEAMLPSALKPAYKAAELGGVIGPGGYTDSQGNPTGQPMGSWDVGLQALGFRTQDKATHDEAKYNYGADQEALQARRQVLGERMYRAVTQGGDVGAAMQGITGFDMSNPYQPIRDVGDDVRNRMMGMQMGMATGLYTPLTRKQIAPAENEVGYAAMPAAR